MICPQLYYYKYSLLKAPLITPEYFDEGSLLHKIMEIYYGHKIKNEPVNYDIMYELGKNYAAKHLSLSAEATEETIKDCKMYFNYYEDQGSTWVIEAVEEPFAKELYSGKNIRIVISGKVDMRARTMSGKGPRVIIDHKYEGRFREKRERDNQPLAYSWAFDTKDFIYNRIGKQKSYKPEKRLARPYFNYSKHQIEEWKEAAIYAALEVLKYNESDYWPMRITGCNLHGNKCTFYDVCNTTPDNREYKLNSLFGAKKKHDLMEGDKG